jgi:RNA polymerase sigma-70 factor (ECF subfamily)
VNRLSTSQRAVVVLRFHLDWSLEQIAAALGVPVGTVKSRLHRALSSLRETLGGDHES